MQMPDPIDPVMLAPCGMNCMVCYVHLKDNKPCSGCLGDDGYKPKRCLTCAIMTCAQERGFVHCFSCDEHPCKRIKNLERSYRKRYRVSLVGNSQYAQEHGLDAFMVRERGRWCCADCGGVISLHDAECSGCGTTVEFRYL